jgi:uncharacterized protein (DUF1015 family)
VQILPSSLPGPGLPRSGQALAGLEFAPFRGVRYARDRVSGLAEVTSPPYDVIFRDSEDQLMAADPHNVVRLILPRPVAGQPGAEYHEAALSLQQWMRDGILAADPVPALYVYEQSAGGRDRGAAGPAGANGRDGIQRGLIGALRLVPPAAGVVLPHEDVSPGPVAGRLALMEATQANLEPIFLLYDGRAAANGGSAGHGAVPDGAVSPGAAHGAAARIVTRTATRRAAEPLVDACTPDGKRHRLWAITDPGDQAAIAADLAPRQALIADGHHRYAAYRKLQERRRAAGSGAGPWDYGLALLVDSASYPPRIGAIHRVIDGLDVRDAAKLATAAFLVRQLPGGSADLPAAERARAEAGATGPAFVLAGQGQAYLLTDPDPEQADAAMPDAASAHWRALPASILQKLLITAVWGVTDDDSAVRVVHHDAAAAVRAADDSGGTAVLCEPMRASDVYAVAARGEKVPRKSTSFAPKPRTGLVLRTFAQG